MNDIAVAQRIVADVLAIRGAAPGGGVFMRGIDPEHMAPDRLRMAKRFGHMVPSETTMADIDRVARGIVPFLKSDGGVQAASPAHGSGRPFVTT